MSDVPIFYNCPYFQFRKGEKLYCEGIHHADRTCLCFATENRLRLHTQLYCANADDPLNYKRCGIAARLEKEYGMAE